MNGESLAEFRETGMITPERMRAIDQNAIALGVSSLQMMESAGKALADAALSLSPARVLILCGKGNNGGDGIAAARYLQYGAETDVCYTAIGEMSTECAYQLGVLRHSGVRSHQVRCREDVVALESLFARADVIIDAILGIGAEGLMRDP